MTQTSKLCLIFNQVMMKTLVPIRSFKLSSDESFQYLNGCPFNNNRYCKQSKVELLYHTRALVILGGLPVMPENWEGGLRTTKTS